MSRTLRLWTGALIGLYPPAFRRRAGTELARLLRDGARDAAGEGPGRLAAYVTVNTLSCVRDALAEWLTPLAGLVLAPLGSLGASLRRAPGDVRRAARTLLRRPRFSVVVVLTLAVGVGASGAVFALAHEVLFRAPDGVRDERGAAYLTFDSPERAGVAISGPAVEALRGSASRLAGMATYRGMLLRILSEGARPVDARAQAVYGDYFELLGVTPVAGRLLTAEETGPDADPGVAVISERLARQLFGDPTRAVGRTLEANGESLTVLGVAGGAFRGTDRNWPVEAWLPASAFVAFERYPRERLWSPAARLNQFFLARPHPWASPAAVKAELEATLERLAQSDPEHGYLGELRASLTPGLMSPFDRGRLRGTIAVLAAGALLLLLITCANVANLLLVQGAHRRGDAAVARALGASPAAVARERLAESLVLAGAGSAAGLAVAWGIARAFRGLSLFGLPELGGLTPGAPTLLFVLAAVAVTTVLSGTLPALVAGRLELSGTLRDTSLHATTRSGALRFGVSALQVALSLTLLIGSTLLVRTVRNLYAVDPGVALEGVHALTLELRRELPDGGAELDAFYQRILDAVASVPGVRGAALNSSYGPYQSAPQFRIATPAVADEDAVAARIHWVTPGWFELFGVSALSGRTLGHEDWTSTSLRTVLTAALAERLFGTTEVLGRRVRVGIRTFEEAEIVGVIGDVRLMRLSDAPDEAFFLARPVAGLTTPVTVLFRPEGADTPLRVQRALEAALPTLPIADPAPLVERIDARLTEQRLFARLLTLFSALAVVLAGVGVYGVVSFALTARRRELAVRIALGADAPRLRRLVLGSAAGMLAVGIGGGLAAAAALSRLIEARLFGVQALDAPSYLLSAGVMALVGLMAFWIPAREALRTDPVQTLRRVAALVGVLLACGAPLRAQQVDAVVNVTETEERAKRLLDDYYDELLFHQCVYLSRGAMNEEGIERKVFRPVCQLPAACRAASLQECFGGESLCYAANYECWVRANHADRAALLAKLDSLATLSPASDWIVGQRVSLAVKNGQLARALVTAEGCEGTTWWCQALRGYVRHRREPGSGEVHLDSALAAAPRDLPTVPPAWKQDDKGLVCEWRSLSYVLHPSLLPAYERLPCGERGATETRFWWLADPLWSVPWNSRRSEHLARFVQLRLDGDVRPRPANHPWFTPAGVYNSWRFVPLPRQGSEPDHYLDRHEPYTYGGYSFAPDEGRFRDPMASSAEDWGVEWNRGRERMITREEWHDLAHHQTAVLRRGDSLIAVAAAQLPVIAPSLDSVRATLAMGRVSDLFTEVVPATVELIGVARAEARLESGDWMASLELQGPGWVGRARHGAPAPALVGGFGVSDPVLVDERFDAGTLALHDAILPTTDLTGRSRVGIYFEVYGVAAEEPLRVAVSAERTDRSLLQRALGALRLSSTATLAVNWHESAETPTSGTVPRYLGLDVSGLAPGEYRLRVAVEREGGATAVGQRRVRVTGR